LRYDLFQHFNLEYAAEVGQGLQVVDMDHHWSQYVIQSVAQTLQQTFEFRTVDAEEVEVQLVLILTHTTHEVTPSPHLKHNMNCAHVYTTVGHPNKGHYGANNFILCKKVVPISEVK
jgi:hypothetical protein